MSDLYTLGGTNSEGRCINTAGQISGDSYLLGDTESHAFYTGGTMSDLLTLGGSESSGYGINKAGEVTGYSYIFV